MIVDKNIHVLHIASGDLWAGAEVQLFTLAKTQQSDPATVVSVIIMNHGRLEQELINAGINVTVIDETKLNGIKILFKLISNVRKISPDVIHTHRLKENVLGSIAAFISGDIPSIRTAHGAPEHAPSWRKLPKLFIYWLDWFCGRFLQKKIISVSGDLADLLENDFPPKKIEVIENGIDLQITQKHAREKNTNKLRETKVLNIGIAGRLVPVKRVDIFIKTARHVLDFYPQLKAEFHIYGDGPLRDELKQLSHKINTETVVFFEGHCDNILHKLGKLDALLITSDHEGLPMVLLEAMALEIPIIAHAVGGIPNLIDQGRCGILVEDNNAQVFASAINQLMNSSERIPEITKNASNRIKEKYSARSNAQAYYSQYLSILE